MSRRGDEALFRRYLDGELSEFEARQLLGRLRESSSLRAAIREEEGLDRLLALWAEAPPPSEAFVARAMARLRLRPRPRLPWWHRWSRRLAASPGRLTATAAAAGLGGLTFWLLAERSEAARSAIEARTDLSPEARETWALELEARGRGRRQAAVALGATAAVLLGAGLSWWILEAQDAGGASAQVAAAPLSGGVAGVVRMRLP
ncbi:MAG: hypothetical protein D6729_19295 [Deltaproteobacteria bacterium]|nr:MAG: hypothetical protein D6729_19295 [Deltaproteobacteria bacterium]